MNIGAGGGAFAFVAIFFGLITTVIWMFIGWRAMRAHERLADAAERAIQLSRDGIR
ncbi:MAG: hypothetical protein ABI852_01700 [Gemmatimonadaceae bacterium]